MTPAARQALFLLALLAGFANEATAAEATYLANEGVMITDGGRSILFDPLFDSDYGQYRLLAPSTEAALLAGEAPFDRVEAVFVSHYHGDHFAPDLMLAYLERQPGVHLYAPAQAVALLRDLAGDAEQALFARITGLALSVGDAPVRIEAAGITVEAVRIPHAGWPERRTDVENLAFRVTLDGELTVLHLGDADPRPSHYARDPAFWAAAPADVAFPPYWYFLSPGGRAALADHLKPRHAVGIHVPVDVPADPARRPPELAGADLFTTPGETRRIPVE